MDRDTLPTAGPGQGVIGDQEQGQEIKQEGDGTEDHSGGAMEREGRRSLVRDRAAPQRRVVWMRGVSIRSPTSNVAPSNVSRVDLADRQRSRAAAGTRRMRCAASMTQPD